MPGPLLHSPAHILLKSLVDLGLGYFPSGVDNVEWSVFCDNEPDRPDNVITIYNTFGRNNGRTQPDGETQEHHGIQVRVRASTSTLAYPKAREIAVALDQDIYQQMILIGTQTYCIHSVTRLGDVVPLGKDTPTPTKRSIYTINALMMVRQKGIVGTGTGS